MNDQESVFDVTASDFETAVLARSHRVLVLVDFWASWCQPCRMLTPVLERVVHEHQGQAVLAKVDTDAEQRLAWEYGIRSLPTVKLFRNGAVVDEFYGVQPEPAIREMLERYVTRESDRALALARGALEEGDAERALGLMRKALGDDPANEHIHPELARALIREGQLDEAEEVLSALSPSRKVDSDIRSLAAELRFARVAQDAPPPETLESAVAENPADYDARYRLSAVRIMRGDYEGAMDELLEIMRRDRAFGDDAGRQGLLAVFDMLGGEGPLVARYRQRMASALH